MTVSLLEHQQQDKTHMHARTHARECEKTETLVPSKFCLYIGSKSVVFLLQSIM